MKYKTKESFEGILAAFAKDETQFRFQGRGLFVAKQRKRATKEDLVSSRERQIQKKRRRYQKKKQKEFHKMYKSELCYTFQIEGQKCPYGDTCRFAHGEEDLTQNLDPEEARKRSAKAREKYIALMKSTPPMKRIKIDES